MNPSTFHHNPYLIIVTFYHTLLILNNTEEESFLTLKQHGKRRKCWLPALIFLYFPHFSTLPITNFIFWVISWLLMLWIWIGLRCYRFVKGLGIWCFLLSFPKISCLLIFSTETANENLSSREKRKRIF